MALLRLKAHVFTVATTGHVCLVLILKSELQDTCDSPVWDEHHDFG